MNRVIFLALVSCALFGSVLSILEELRDQVFAEDGESRMKPAKTLQALRKLSIAYCGDDCSGCNKMKLEVDRLIATSEATEDKCTQKSVDRINKLIRVYSKYQLNLIPFLQYYKKELIRVCEEQFEVANLRWESVSSNYWDDDRNSADTDYANDSETNNAKDQSINNSIKEDQLNNVMEKKEEQLRLKEKREEQYSQNLERHLKANEDWMKRYNQVFLDTANIQEPKKLLNTLINLDKDFSSTFGLDDTIKKKLGDLINLRYFTVFICNSKQFNTLNALGMEFRQGYNPSIMKYIKYYRDSLRQKCTRSFLEGLNKKPSFKSDQAEVFSLVDHVFASDQPNSGHHTNDLISLVRKGLQGYSRDKLGNQKPYDKDEINKLLEDTVEPACESVELRFYNVREFGDVLDDNQDFKDDLDELSLKWLRALKVCTLINNNPELLGQTHSYLSQDVPTREDEA